MADEKTCSTTGAETGKRVEGGAGLLLTKGEFAGLLRVGESTFDRYRAAGRVGPRALRIGGSLRWSRAEVEEWVKRPTPRGELMDADTWPTVWADSEKRRAK